MEGAEALLQLHHRVRLDSTLILRAAQRVVSEPGFDEMLDQTRDRVDAIEGASVTVEMCILSRDTTLTAAFPPRLIWSGLG